MTYVGTKFEIERLLGVVNQHSLKTLFTWIWQRAWRI